MIRPMTTFVPPVEEAPAAEDAAPVAEETPAPEAEADAPPAEPVAEETPAPEAEETTEEPRARGRRR